MAFEKNITVTATINQIPFVTDFVQSNLEQADCPLTKISKICIAIDEILNNISNYAYKEQSGDITIHLSISDTPKICSVSFIDKGTPFNPLESDSPDISLAAADREIGGLGILMVKKLMDYVGYEYKDDQNILTIKINF